MCRRHMQWIRKTMLPVVFAAVLWGQKDTGTISGTVKDPTGALVPEASVRVLNVLTGIAFNTRTNETGHFSAPALRVGDYELSVEKPGFKRAVQSGITLQVNQVLALDITLEVGQV